MGEKGEKVAFGMGHNEKLVDILDKVLGPADQAWFVCAFDDCTHFAKGHCQIFTIATPPDTPPGVPCDRYERRA